MSNSRISEISKFIDKNNEKLRGIDTVKEEIRDIVITREFGRGTALIRDLGIDKKYIDEVFKPVLLAKLNEREKIVKKDITEYGRELQQLMGGSQNE